MDVCRRVMTSGDFIGARCETCVHPLVMHTSRCLLCALEQILEQLENMP